MTYQLGVDLGTTWSAAAVCRTGTAAPEPVSLGERSHSVASAVFAGADGSFLLGEAAERRALSDPGRVIREFKRRIGDPTPVLVGRDPVRAEALAARFIGTVVGRVAQREGGPASRIAVTHPAGWGPHKVESLRAALSAQGVGPVVLLTEPQAAAVGYASLQRVEPGSVVAVYDLGGGTFDAAVVRKSTAGRFDLLGTPDGIERLGGVDFDEAVFAHVRAVLGPAWAALDGADPAVAAAVAGLRRECTAAKEALSSDTVVHVPVMLPGLHTRVRLGRAEFEDMIRPAVGETVDALRRALDSAGVTPAELTALLLVGGASRTPLVSELVSAGVGLPASVDVDPKAVIAAGAALVARATEEQARGAAAASALGSAASGTDAPGVQGVAAATLTPAAVVAAHGAGAVASGAASPGVGVSGAASSGAGASGGASSGAGDDAEMARPPRQARPFSSGAAPRPRSPRTVAMVVAASVLAAAVVAGVIVLASRPGPGAAASTPTPEPVTGSVPQLPVVPTTTQEPAPQVERTRQRQDPPAPPPTTTTEPTPTTEPTTTEPTTTEPTTEPTTTDPTTTEPDPGAEGGGEQVPEVGAGGAVPGAAEVAPPG